MRSHPPRKRGSSRLAAAVVVVAPVAPTSHQSRTSLTQQSRSTGRRRRRGAQQQPPYQGGHNGRKLRHGTFCGVLSAVRLGLRLPSYLPPQAELFLGGFGLGVAQPGRSGAGGGAQGGGTPPPQRFLRSCWAGEGLWACQEGQMGQKMVCFAGLSGTGSRQDESKEVHEVGSKRPSLFGEQHRPCRFAVPPDMAVTGWRSLPAECAQKAPPCAPCARTRGRSRRERQPKPPLLSRQTGVGLC
jgi:hypothetical protein